MVQLQAQAAQDQDQDQVRSEPAPPARPPGVRRGEGQPWPLIVEAGVIALGFHPFARSPSLSVGSQWSFLRRGGHQLGTGLAIGGYSQPAFARGVLLDTGLFYRWTAPVGVYLEPDLLLGGQLSRGVGRRFAADQAGRFHPSSGAPMPAARVGLGLAIGFDLGALRRAPLRLFVRYRQVVLAPFMPNNDVPVMGLAALSAGIVLNLGALRR